MFESDEVPSSYIEDYKTLHHDIGLVKRSNGLWDLWFGQDEISENYKDAEYLNIVEGDIVSATEVHSLQVGIIVACLTSWNYLNRSGNPIYKTFGNEAYSLLKRNKGTNTKYKIKQYFINCLENMRRVYSVEYLDVYEVENNPYIYKVKFRVLSITNTLVDGEFYLNMDSSKNTSVLDLSYNHPYTSVANPLYVECTLRNEYGAVIEGEVIYIYIRSDENSEFKFYGITEATDSNGKASVTIPPRGLSVTTQVMFVFKGNEIYNPCVSKVVNIESVAYYIKSEFTYKNVDDVDVIDKQILYIEDSKGNKIDDDKFRLGELLSDYTDIDNLTISDSISLTDIVENTVRGNILEYHDREIRKMYLVPTSRYIEGTEKVYYDGYCWNDEHDALVLVYSYTKVTGGVQLNTHNPNEVHFLINSEDNGWFEIDLNDGHLYYKINEYEYEF